MTTPTPQPRTALNLGCSDTILSAGPVDRMINVDIADGPGVDMVCDLREPWPWEDSSIDHVVAHDVFEHLPNKLFTMNELWRVLKHGGTASVIVPSALGSGAFQDPTHVSFWVERSFLYVMHNCPYRDRFAKAYGITACFTIASIFVEQTPADGPRIVASLVAVKE